MKKFLCTLMAALLLTATLAVGFAASAEVLEHKHIVGGVTVTENEAGDPVITVGGAEAHRIYPDTWSAYDFDGFHFKLTDMQIPAGNGTPAAFCIEKGIYWWDNGNIPFFTIRRADGKDTFHAFNTEKGGPAAVWLGVTNPVELTNALTDTLDFYVYKIGEFWYFEINGQVIPMNKAADGSAQKIEDSLLKGHHFDAKICAGLGWGLEGQTYVLKEFGPKKAAPVSVNEQIAALPETVTLADKAAVLACKGAYEALTETQRAVVVGYDKVTAALARIEELERAASEDDLLVANLMADIEAIPAKVTAADRDSVLALKARYEALNEELQARITNYSKVTEALAAIEKIEKAEEKPETPPETGAALPVTAIVLSAAALAAVWMLKERQKVR